MNDLTIFNYGDSAIRTIEQNGESWWVLVDVCKVLEIKNVTQVASRLDDDEKGMFDIGLKTGNLANCVNEPGLYSLILRSDKQEAKNFKRWVTHEVLPQIRNKGSYNSKREIAELILSCKTAAAVKGILALYDVKPKVHVPQNSRNSVSLFLQDRMSMNLTVDTQKEVYTVYQNFCAANKLVPSTLANFSREIRNQTGLIVTRHRVNGILTGYYTEGSY